MKKLFIGLSLLAIATFAFAEPFVWPAAWSNAAPGEAVYGGTLKIAFVGDPRTFNPVTSAESQALSDFLFNTGAQLLMRGPDSDDWLPYAAESYTVNDEGTQIDIVLRDGMTWSDGSPITTQDYYIRYVLETDPDVGSNGYDGWFMDDDPITLEKVGDNGLRFHFPRPDRLAFPVAAMVPVPDAIFGEAYRTGGAEAVKALWGTNVDVTKTVWSTAFIPTVFQPGERIILERNPHFGDWNVDEAGNRLPFLDGYNMTVVADLDTSLNLYIAGETDTFNPRNLDDIGVINQAVNNGDIDVIVLEAVSPVASSQFIVWNWNKASDPDKQALFRNVNFRRAMAHVMDRDAIIDLVYNGSGVPMYTNVYPINTFWINDDVEKYPYDPEAASELMASIGYDKKNSDGILVNAEGKTASFILATNAGNTAREQIAGIFADSAREIGVDVQVQPIDFNLLVDQLLSEGDDRPFDAILIGLTGGSRDWPFGVNVIPCGTNLHMYNTSGGCLTAQETLMGQLFNVGREELDTEAARKVGLEIQATEADLMPILYAVSPMAHYSWASDIKGFHHDDEINALVGAWELPMIFKAD
ncbi:MAG: ABC transporter substrate-binding protein [Truepera sp.]|jgi:peptide/nickel transport system substrate-binding protein|nr:ABC transporter substrate-binding protein [Truepera sp.]